MSPYDRAIAITDELIESHEQSLIRAVKNDIQVLQEQIQIRLNAVQDVRERLIDERDLEKAGEMI